MNYIVPLENWVKLGNYIYNNTYSHNTNNNTDIMDIVDINYEHNEGNNEENNNNNVFNKSYILHKILI